MNTDKLVDDFKLENELGFNMFEMEEIKASIPDLNIEMFNQALVGITCPMVDNKLLIYPWDVKKAIDWGLGKRKLFLG